MRIVTYNIQYGRGKDGRFDLDRITGEVAGADLVALQEVERFWERSGNVDQPAEIARLMRDYYWVYGAGVDLHASGRGPEPSFNRRRQFGNMLLSRRPILSSRNHLLPKYASLGPMSIQRSALEGVVDTEAGPLRFYSVHLTHLSPATRRPQIEMLLDMHRRAPSEGAAIAGAGLKEEWLRDGLPVAMPRAALFMGDFNLEPGSGEYDLLAGPVCDYGGRIVNPEGLADAWTAVGHDESEGVTADVGGRPVRLDYCFVSGALVERLESVRIDAAAAGSDHQPVWIEINL